MSKRMWGGRFSGTLDPRIDALNQSFPFDRRLAEQDVAGSLAWSRALVRVGVLTSKEQRTIAGGLEQVRIEFATNKFRAHKSDEDIHTAVERRLIELVGDPGQKLHTGRSRNDQVATDLNLWLKAATNDALAGLRELMLALLDLAARAGDTALPAYTHLQRAQPVLAAHHLLAYAEMLGRDRARLEAAHRAADVMPLGCGAAAGTGFAIDRRALAKDLDFRQIAANSLDAVGSRDAVLDYLSALTIAFVHFSRLGEELIAWASSEFGFVTLGDTAATGSSLLPQKRNPDGAELARGKAGRVAGHLFALVTTMKGLPLAYNKDLQEDKEATFDAHDTFLGVAGALAATLEGVAFAPDRCEKALAGGHLLATEIADYLVRKGMPFRKAHGVAGRLVQHAETAGIDVSQLDLATMQSEAEEIGPDIAKALTVRAALRAKQAFGGTAPKRVKTALATWQRRVATW